MDPNCLKGVDDLFLGCLMMSNESNDVYVFRWFSCIFLLGRGRPGRTAIPRHPEVLPDILVSGFHWATSMRERSCTMYAPDTSTITSTQESAAAWSQIDRYIIDSIA